MQNFPASRLAGKTIFGLNYILLDIYIIFYRHSNSSEFDYYLKESDIIVKCMLLCMEQDISVLPIHDALIFPFDKKHEGTEIMKRVFKEKTGLDGIIKIE